MKIIKPKPVFRSKDIVTILAVSAAILLIPLIAMQFTSEVKWTKIDFIVMGILLVCTGLSITLALRVLTSNTQRAVVTGALLLGLLLVWAELSVGIIGTPFAGQ